MYLMGQVEVQMVSGAVRHAEQLCSTSALTRFRRPHDLSVSLWIIWLQGRAWMIIRSSMALMATVSGATELHGCEADSEMGVCMHAWICQGWA